MLGRESDFHNGKVARQCKTSSRSTAMQRCPHMTYPAVSPDSAAAATSPDPVAKTWNNPRKGFLFFVGFAAIGAGMAQLVPAIETIALKATDIVGKEQATGTLSLTVAIAALVSLIATPLFG